MHNALELFLNTFKESVCFYLPTKATHPHSTTTHAPHQTLCIHTATALNEHSILNVLDVHAAAEQHEEENFRERKRGKAKEESESVAVSASATNDACAGA